MSYTPTNWVDGETPVNAENLNKLENAVLANSVAIDEINTARENGEFQGDDGKSAYAYAQDGGYTGTEEEFAAKLASDGGGAAFYINVSGSETDGYTVDKTGAEIEEAYASSRPIYCWAWGKILRLTDREGGGIAILPIIYTFEGISENVGYRVKISYKKSAGTTEVTENEIYPLVTQDSVNKMIEAKGSIGTSVKAYGAVGDGNTDDTQSFKDALAANRVVFVPGGTYLLSDAIVVRDNCSLELAQDTVLNFNLTNGNCITLEMSASLRGNHATVFVPYEFSGNVINVSSTTSASQSATPPWTMWDPQWKSGRYVTDLNICKRDSRGFHYSVDGNCSGKAVSIYTDDSGAQSFIWGLHFSGLRIAGAFNYGIYAENIDTYSDAKSAYNHEMRIDALIDACEIGVYLSNCNNAYISAIVQPRMAYTEEEQYIPYAKHGIKLVNSKNADLSGSRVWDWKNKTLWTAGGEYQHLALIGECRGLILNDFLYYEDETYDIRELIHTDTASNLEQMTILQEPFTRWFKPVDGVPHFFDGNGNKRLLLEENMGEYFQTDRIAGFTDILKVAGYTSGLYLDSAGGENTGSDFSYYVSTGFLPCKAGDVLHIQNISFDYALTNDTSCKIVYYDANKNYLYHQGVTNIMTGTKYYQSGERTEDGLKVTLNPSLSEKGTVAYVRFTFHRYDFGANPAISVNQEIKYTQEGFLSDSIKVKGTNVILYSPGGKAYGVAVDDNGNVVSNEIV